MDGTGQITEIASNLGSLGVLIFLFWRIITKTIPDLTEKFKDELDEQRKDFLKTMEDHRNDFQASINNHRDFFEQMLCREKENNNQNINRLASSIDNISRNSTGVQ